ncbi:MAG: MBL fold metallo-hydrolase [bacterium]|nr:MBL fold metallo-hydrolase [bacterium]
MIRSYDDTPGLHLIDLDQDDPRLPGQRRFISCWVWATKEVSFVVDPGPPSTGEYLLAALDELGIMRLDFILLTHIHLDHAGTTARVLERFPQARVVCHERGRGHLVAPSRLWEGSLSVLREKAQAYGEPEPVPESALADFDEAAARGIETILTPGHAPHHLCFHLGTHLFLGEAAGTYATLGRGCDTPEPYLRPATPPVFKLEVAQESLDRLLALDPPPGQLLFAHHGRHCSDARRVLRDAREQLELWVTTMGEVAGSAGGLPAEGVETEFFALVVQALAVRDPHFARRSAQAADIRVREADFTAQTLRGMLGYLRSD